MTVRAALLPLAALAVALAPAPRAAAQLTPLTEGERQITAALPEDEGATVERPYVVSNEWRHSLWFDSLEGLGGALVGVGADQNYTLAAASGATMLFMVDYDSTIPRVHRMYEALVTRSETPDALLAHFAPRAEEASAALIEEHLAGQPDAARVARLYRRFRHRLQRYLGNMRRYRHGRTWLNEDAWYAHVRGLFLAHRVVARTGDVTRPTTLRAIGDAARELGQEVRVVYLSNAEMFFPNGPELVANMQNLPTGERTILLRTVHNPRLPDAPLGRWHYVVQPFADYLRRLATGNYYYANSMSVDLVRAGRRRVSTVEGLSRLDDAIPLRE